MADQHAHHEEVGRKIAEHARAIDTLHEHLRTIGHPDKAKLEEAFAKYKKAHKTFHDDCLECWKG